MKNKIWLKKIKKEKNILRLRFFDNIYLIKAKKTQIKII